MKKINKIEIKNRKAYHDYEIIDKYVAGIILVGPEIKSIRKGEVSFTDSFCMFNDNELFVKSLYIAEYENTSFNDIEPKRDRKLLLTKKELLKLYDLVSKQGVTIIPLKLYFKNGFVKLQIGLAKGKKQHDKRNSIREQDLKREQDRDLRL